MDYKKLTLMNKNTPVCDINYHPQGHFCTEITKVWNIDYASPALIKDNEITADTFNAWWRRRAIPVTRIGFEQFLSCAKITDSRVLLDLNHGLSLSDRYWVNDGTHSWDEINYFDNPFTDDLGILTLQPEGIAVPNMDNTLALLNPSSSLGGNLKKKWSIAEDGTRVLYKRCSGYPGFAAYGEEIATELFKCVFDSNEYVPYKVEKDGKNLFTVCPNMLKDDEELIPGFDLIINKHHYENSYPSLIDLLNSLNISNTEEFICNMLACDFLIANEDRHYNNFGVIRNVETLEYVRMAPIYDSGECLWGYRLDLNPERSHEYYAKPFGSPVGEDAMKIISSLPSYSKLLNANLSPFYEKTEKILQSMDITRNRADTILKSIHHQEEILRGLELKRNSVISSEQNIDNNIDNDSEGISETEEIDDTEIDDDFEL